MKNTGWRETLAFTAAGTLVVLLCASRWMPAHHVALTKIAVAAVDIDLGQRLEPRFITLIDWPAGSIPPGTFSDPHKLDGRVLSASMTRGTPLTERELRPLKAFVAGLHDYSDTAAWLSLLGEPWGPSSPPKPAT